MKIRKGFVSNSSTTSFMIYGTVFNMDEFMNLENNPDREKFVQLVHDTVQRYNLETSYLTRNLDKSIQKAFDDPYDNDVFEFLIDSYVSAVGLSLYMYPPTEETFIGCHFAQMQENETLKEFKQRVIQIINELFPGMFKDENFSIIERAYQDG